MSTKLRTWFIEPHDPLIFRDGRPFEPTPGARAKSLPFPFPSTTAGGVRTQAKTNKYGIFDTGTNDKEEENGLLARLKQLQVYGPLLVELMQKEQGQVEPRWLVPAPLDALLLQAKDRTDQYKITVNRLEPLALADALTDLAFPQPGEDTAVKNLSLVGQAEIQEGEQQKPFSKAPRYWYWEHFLQWLEKPQEMHGQEQDVRKLGHNGPLQERRVHLGMDATTHAGLDGALFDTLGMEFIHKYSTDGTQDEQQQKTQSMYRRLALAVAVEETQEFRLGEGLNCFGGERRIVCWRRSESALLPCTDTLTGTILEQRCCRLILLTPGYFKSLAAPEYLLNRQSDFKIKIQAIATQRPQVVSGFDIHQGKRKSTRRLAPAGTVFFLDLRENSKEAIKQWITRTWMRNISDEEQESFDGFGLAVLGTWSGKLAELVVKPKDTKGHQS